MDREHLPQFNKGPHDFNVNLNRLLASQHTGKHGNALFRKSVWFWPATTAPTWNHNLWFQVGKFFFRQLEHEIFRKPVNVSFYRLNKHPRLNTIKLRQSKTQHYLLSTEQKNTLLNVFYRSNFLIFRHPLSLPVFKQPFAVNSFGEVKRAETRTGHIKILRR